MRLMLPAGDQSAFMRLMLGSGRNNERLMAEHDARPTSDLDRVGADPSAAAAPGKRSASERLPVQRRAVATPALASADTSTGAAPLDDPFAFHLAGAVTPIQRKTEGADASPSNDGVHAAAARGVQGAGGSLPHLDQIQAAFGHHDVSGVQAFVGGQAATASAAMGAEAYATGNSIGFAAPPSLHTAAHEAAHVVQQQAGVHLQGGVGQEGDPYERAADRVADAVVEGKSAAALLDEHAGPAPRARGGETQRKSSSVGDLIQRKWSQTEVKVQDSHHGGVKSQYTSGTNLVELHIEAGANDNGTMMADFLTALWEARDAITLGVSRAAGGLFMRPGGAQVLKMTMEMLAETFGSGESLEQAQLTKKQRQKDKPVMGGDNDTIDQHIVPEHKAYRDSMVGAQGVTMAPIGGGTSGGTVNMLENSDDGKEERRKYDEAIFGLKPLLGLAVTVDLAGLNSIIAMMEGKMTFFQRLALKLSYAKNG